MPDQVHRAAGHTKISATFAECIATLPLLRIACIGDAMLDVEVSCAQGRISPEAPTLVFAEQETRHSPGGAANVAVSLAALGVDCVFAGLVGQDDEGRALRDSLAGFGVVAELLEEPGRPTSRKTRFVSSGQQVLRIDREDISPVSASISERLVNALPRANGRLNAVVVSDYGKGTVTAATMAGCRAMAGRHDVPLLVDPKGRDWARYGLVDLIKPNASELAAFTGMACETDEEVEAALTHAMDLCQARAIVVTRSGQGASIATRDGTAVRHVRAQPAEVADVRGAGDTNLAALACMLAAGASLDESVEIAQVASLLAVQRHGNAAISAQDLLDHPFSRMASTCELKIKSGEALARQVAEWRAGGLRLGFTNGCFDILHSGHVHSLDAARLACDRLVVGLNSDASVKRLKGASRPILPERDRARLLAALSMVDLVAIFDEDTPENLITALRPDVLVKGGDYQADGIVGADFVKGYGGTVVISDFVSSLSTTGIIETIRSAPRWID